MSNKRSRSPAPPTQPGEDDLTAIDGIGPAITQRLNDAGILTFSQLAALSPEEIVSKIGHQAGLSAHRVAEEDWIGQARVLAPQQAPAREPEPPKTPDSEQRAIRHNISEMLPEETPNRQHNATFTVELLISAGGEVRKTSVAHVQSGHVELQALCSGWEPARLVEYIVERAGLRVAEPAQDTVESLRTQPPAPQVQRDLSGTPTLRELAVVPTGDDRPHNILHHDQTFHVQLALDLADVVMPAEQMLDYLATVIAKRMGSTARQTLGQVRGQTPWADTLALDIEAGKLPEGLYRLEASIDLELAADATNQLPTHKTQLKGGLLQVY